MHDVKGVRIRIYSVILLLRISPYSVRMRENADQNNNSEYGHLKFAGEKICIEKRSENDSL